jgi:hypothetical protein
MYLQNQADGDANSKPIEIESLTEKHPVKKIIHNPEQAQAPSTATTKNSSNHFVSLSDLGMRLNTDPVQEATNPQEMRPSTETTDDDGWDIMNPDPRVARFNQYIYNTVQGWLDRDAYLNSKPLYGTVKLKIWFTKNGEYLENETIFDAIDEDFREIVKRALRKSFTNPIPHPFLYQKEKFFIIRQVVVRH